MIASGTRLGRYEIRAKLGEGGMGEVYLAQDTTELGRTVAVKVLSAEVASDPKRMQRFVQEAKTVSALNHPNILTIYEFGQDEATRFIAAEFVDGVTLRGYMRARSLKLHEVLDIAAQVAAALDAAHEAHVTHRDIKPENVMVRRRDTIVKVLDFGLAKLSEPSAVAGGPTGSEDATMVQMNTEPGVVMGTVSYMSPEQTRGLSTVDQRTDIWSLGALLYELVAGRVPFEGKDVHRQIIAIQEEEPPPLSRFAAGVPERLEDIVAKALAKDPNERYQTAKDMLIDLRNLKRKLEVDAEIDRTISPDIRAAASTRSGQSNLATVSGTAAPTAQPHIPPAASSAEYVVSGIKQHKLAVAAVTAAVLIVGAVSLFLFLRGRTNTAAIQSIAVMPFVNESGNADVEYLSDGMTDTLISNLSQLPNLSVKAHSSVFRYKGKETSPQTIARDLNVQAILNGRIAQRGDQLTLTLELVDAKTENVIWSDQYNRQQADLVSLQSEIARDVSTKLRSKLSGTEAQKVARTYTANPEAYQLYLRGLFYWNKRTGEALKTSIDYFSQAVAKDPNYAQAYAGMALAYVLLPEYSAGSPAESMPKAKAAATRALALDDTLAEAHTALAYILFAYDHNVSESEREFQRAIQLNPNFATAHQWYAGKVLTNSQRFDEAIAEGKRAVELDPLAIITTGELSADYYYARQYDEAIAQARKNIELNPSWYLAHEFICQNYIAKGQAVEAIRECQKASELDNDPSVLSTLAYAQAASGKKEEALKTVAQLTELAKRRYVPAYSFATAYAGLGDKDQAFQWLERCFQDRAWEITYIKVDPLMDTLRSDPRFADLVRRVGV
jgi:serine/threonine-protein kinase